MEFDRRRFLGALAVGSASLAVTPAKPLARNIALPPASAELTPMQSALLALDRHRSLIAYRDVMGIVDFTAPSHRPRFYLMGIDNGMASSHLVAHGRGSDPDNSGWVERLSNVPGSNASSGGSFLTGDTYVGKHGKSRRLIGLDPDNSMAAPRAIVIHAASYVDDRQARQQGRIGRSQGCFAVSSASIDEVLSHLGPGRLLFAWNGPDANTPLRGATNIG